MTHNSLTLEQLLHKEASADLSRPKKNLVFIYKRIAEFYKEANELQRESEYLEKAVALENNLK